MTHFGRLSSLILFVLLFGLPMATFAQDREKLMQEIESLKAQVKEKEKVLLEPSKEDKAAYTTYLAQSDRGLFRLMPREKYQSKMLINGGGSYYSFSRFTHEYGYGSDISLEQGKLQVGFAGADF